MVLTLSGEQPLTVTLSETHFRHLFHTFPSLSCPALCNTRMSITPVLVTSASPKHPLGFAHIITCAK